MGEQLVDFVFAIAGIMIFFSAMGLGCAVWENTLIAIKRRKKRKGAKKCEPN